MTLGLRDSGCNAVLGISHFNYCSVKNMLSRVKIMIAELSLTPNLQRHPFLKSLKRIMTHDLKCLGPKTTHVQVWWWWRTPLCDLLSGCGDAELLLALSQFEQIDGVKKGAAETERKGVRSEEGAG